MARHGHKRRTFAADASAALPARRESLATPHGGAPLGTPRPGHRSRSAGWGGEPAKTPLRAGGTVGRFGPCGASRTAGSPRRQDRVGGLGSTPDPAANASCPVVAGRPQDSTLRSGAKPSGPGPSLG